MNADDGSGQTRLTNNDEDDFNPSWSPDGEKIAFSSDRDSNEEGSPNFDIYVMNADDGSGQTRLTNNDEDDSDPDWGTNTLVPESDGNGSSTTTPSQQSSDEAISASTNDISYDILPFLIEVIQCFTNNDEQFSDDAQLCLYDVIFEYFDNDDDNNVDNNNNSQDNNISSNDNNNNGTYHKELEGSKVTR
jgi:Tol biopolymer transport system component